MLFESVIVVVLALLGVSGLVMWIRLAASCSRTIEAPAAESERVFAGDVMCRYVVTSGSLARLEMFSWGVRLRGIAVSRWIVPTWEARYEELETADLVALPASRTAVWLKLRGESDAIAFLTWRSLEILPLFERHGVPVNRQVTRIRRVRELYQLSD